MVLRPSLSRQRFRNNRLRLVRPRESPEPREKVREGGRSRRRRIAFRCVVRQLPRFDAHSRNRECPLCQPFVHRSYGELFIARLGIYIPTVILASSPNPQPSGAAFG